MDVCSRSSAQMQEQRLECYDASDINADIKESFVHTGHQRSQRSTGPISPRAGRSPKCLSLRYLQSWCGTFSLTGESYFFSPSISGFR